MSVDSKHPKHMFIIQRLRLQKNIYVRRDLYD